MSAWNSEAWGLCPGSADRAAGVEHKAASQVDEQYFSHLICNQDWDYEWVEMPLACN